MKSNSRKKIVYLNTIMTLLTQLLSVLLGFGIRKIFIDTLGVTYLGYNSVFSNILQMLNLADLGMGIAITSFLYKPIADEDTEKINALMFMYKKVYQVLGVIVLGLGILISIFIPLIINDSNSNHSYLRILFFINLLGTVSTYYLAYKRTLLIAAQKSYFTTFVDMLVYLLTSVLQVILLYVYPNYIIYLSVSVAKNIISNILLSIKCTKEYGYLSNTVNKDIINEYKKPVVNYVKDVFISRLGAYIFYSTDNIIISIFKGSLLTGYLSNYTLVTAQVSNVVTQMLASIQATFGNYISTEKSLKNQEDMAKNYLCANYFIGNFCMVCVLFLIQPFVGLFFGGEYLLPFSTAVWLAINLMLTILIQLPSQLFMIYKLYKYDKVIVSISAILNIVISVSLVKAMGVNGVLIGTFVASLIYLFSRIAIVSKKVYKSNYSSYFVRLLGYFLISVISVIFTGVCIGWIPGVGIKAFILKMIIIPLCAMLIPLIFLIFTKEFKYLLEKFVPLKVKKNFYKLKKNKLKVLIFVICITSISLIFSSRVSKIKMVYDAREEILNKRINNLTLALDSIEYKNQRYINISFDDTILLFKDLRDSREIYDSIFDNNTLKYLKYLHEVYGASFTFYCVYQTDDGKFDLSQVPSKYLNEFNCNSEWLKFGFHSLNGNTNYANSSEDTIINDYSRVINELIRITGENSIEKVIRLHNYAGNFESIMAIKNVDNGIVGLLTADDERNSYYFDSNITEDIRIKGKSEVDGLVCISTDLRLENVNDIKQELLNINDEELIVFTHEWILDDKLIKEKLEYICKYAVNNNYSFDFPRYNLQ